MRIENNVLVSMNYYEDGRDIVIPKNVVDIRMEWENGCGWHFDRIDNITVEDGNETFRVIGHALVNIKTNTLITAFGLDKCGGWLTLPNCVETIGDLAFNLREDIITAQIPSNVKRIGRLAFCGSKLETLILHDGIEEIDDYAFSLSPLQNISYFPSKLKRVGSGIFSGCTELNNIHQCDGKNANFICKDGCVIDKQYKSVISCFGENAIVPYGIDCIRRGSSNCPPQMFAPNLYVMSEFTKIEDDNHFATISSKDNSCARDYADEKNLIFRPYKHAYIDVESGSLEHRDDIIRYVAIIEWDGIKTFDEYAKPSYPLSHGAEILTGITNEKLENCRDTILVRQDFLKAIDGCIIIGRGIDYIESCLGVKFERFIDIEKLPFDMMINRLVNRIDE